MSHNSDLICLLVKFGEDEHMRQLRSSGRLYMQRLEAFQALEDSVWRGDQNDGLSALYQADRIVVTIGGVRIEGLAGPVKVSYNSVDQSHIFCITAVWFKQMIDYMSTKVSPIDPNNFGLGAMAVVITNVTEFQNRVRAAAIRQDINMTAGPVEYIDPKSHHGAMDPFKKYDAFAHQNEWRIVVDPTADKIYWLELGSLEDISILVRADEIVNSLQVSVREK